MTTYDLGDGVNLDYLVYDRDGALADATVVLTVTKPSGSTITPAVTRLSLGHYRAATFLADELDAWAYVWSVSGAVVDVTAGAFVVADPAPEPYATLPQLKSWLKITTTDTVDDDLLAGALASVSQEITDICGRTFNRSNTATTRTFPPRGFALVEFDDFYTQTGLVVSVGGRTWASDDYDLHPENGLVNGQPWPYSSLTPCGPRGFGYGRVSITAKWGWATVPDPIHQACLIATSETFSLKDARFGVAGFGVNGDIRVRDNPMVMSKLKPYMRNRLLVG